MGVFHNGFIVARELRKKTTLAEDIFWQYVRKRQFYGLKFRRQHALFFKYFGQTRFFIADFYCKEMRLIVEIDGGIHERQKEYDQFRSEILSQQKELKIIRFKNDDVLNDIDSVLKKLAEFLKLE